MKRSFPKKLPPFWSSEALAALFVCFFFIMGLAVAFAFVVAQVQTLSTKPDASQGLIIFASMVTGSAGVAVTFVVAPALGWLCSSVFMNRTVAEAYSSALVKDIFGLADDDMLMAFVRQWKVRVYRANDRLADTLVHNVAAKLEPLFPLWVAFALFPSRHIGANKICFDRREIDSIKKRMLDSLLAASPEALAEIAKEKDTVIAYLQVELQELKESGAREKEAAVAALQAELRETKEVCAREKDEAIASLEAQYQERKAADDQENASAIAALRSQLQEVTESADNERRDLKKRLTSAGKQINEHLFLGYAGMRLVSVFFEIKMGKKPGRQAMVTKARINEELATLRHEEPLLEKQLALWQRSGKNEQGDEFYDFLRLALPKDMVNWGGYEMTFTEAVEKYFKTTGTAQAT